MITPYHEDVAALRWQLWQNGYRCIAVYTQGKRPFGNAWQDRARQNPPGAVTEPVNDAALSTGILCDGLRAVDIDIDEAQLAQQVENLAYAILGTCPARRRADSSRVLLLYRAASGEPCKRTIEGTRGSVEVLGHGQQFVGFGTHEQGQPYTWAVSPAPYSVNALTAITEEALTAFLAAVGVLIGALVVLWSSRQHRRLQRVFWLHLLTRRESPNQTGHTLKLHCLQNTKRFARRRSIGTTH